MDDYLNKPVKLTHLARMLVGASANRAGTD